MCGITGYISSNKNLLSEEEFGHFNQSLSHRGPDWCEQVQTKRGWLGHTKLNITDASEGSNQPFSYLTDEGILYQMVFNGEIYNFKEIREQLKSLGHSFSTNSDTEVLIKSFSEWGEQCQFKFNGIWAFAIYNSSNGEVFISRDRFGVKPVYLWITKAAVFFASEVKSFRKLPQTHRLPASNEVLQFLSKRPDNSSRINNDLGPLPAGHSVRLKANNKIILKHWWQPKKPAINRTNKPYSELIEEFRFLFSDALRLRTHDASAKCTALSGGLDSSSVFCAIRRLNSNQESQSAYEHKAFSLDYSNTPNSELNFALDVIKATNSDHRLVRLSPDSSLITPELVQDCIYSSEQINHLFLGPFILYRSMSEEGYKVSVDGHGADELLAGYKKFARASIEDCIKESNSESDHNDIKELWIKNGISANEIDTIYKKLLLQNKEERNASAMQQKSFDEFHHITLPWILDTYDKIPMAHNIEVRSPFLDWRIVEFCLALPNNAKVGSGFTKRILRDSMKNIIPKSVRKRHSKQGFAPPMLSFLSSEPLRSYMLDTVNSSLYLNSTLFDGKRNCKALKNAINTENIQFLVNNNFWPTVQATILLDALKKSS